MDISVKSQMLLASIKELLTANNLTELVFGTVMSRAEPVYVVWYDNDGDPYDDPVIKVFLDSDGLSLEVDARNFGNTVRLYEDDFAHEINWLTGIRDNVTEALQSNGLNISAPPKKSIKTLKIYGYYMQYLRRHLCQVCRRRRS